MSLFGNDAYQWRETYFVLFREEDRPSADEVAAALQDEHSEISKVESDHNDRFEADTLGC